MDADMDNKRPNIRIEIKNTATEPMDIDENEKSEEEGEIRDSFSKSYSSEQQSDLAMRNPKDIFRNGADILSEMDQKKLKERAERFALKPEEINSFGEQDLHNLYTSLGITADNADQIRYEALHIRTSELVGIDDIMSYFIEYAPTQIEFVDTASFNVVWKDKLSTARVLFHISQVVRGIPVRAASEHIDNFILDENDASKYSSLFNENRSVELSHDGIEEFNKTPGNVVDISVINIPIPPGYWRLGKKSINSFSVLLRFSLKTDKKPYQIDNCNKYYNKVSSNIKNGKQYKGIFSRNKEISKEAHDKDPWGVLAKNWDEDLMFRERETYNLSEPITDELPIPVPENPELRVRLAAKRRLKVKQEPDESKTSSTPEKGPSDESEQESKRKGVKMPRMRMYADEEEEKIKRRKLLQTLKKQDEKLKKSEIPNSDLRNILKVTNRRPIVHMENNEDLDLSLNLKNRSRKLVFTVAQEGIHNRITRRQILNRLDTIPRRRSISPIYRKPISPIRFEKKISSESYKKHPSIELHRGRRRSPVRERESRHTSKRRYVGRMHSSRSRRHSDDNYSIQKPKSKVALVIKTQKKPSVASAIQSRNRKFDSSSSSSEEDSTSEESDSESSEDDSDESSSSSSEDSDSDSSKEDKHNLQQKRLRSVPLKVEIKNDQYRKK